MKKKKINKIKIKMKKKKRKKSKQKATHNKIFSIARISHRHLRRTHFLVPRHRIVAVNAPNGDGVNRVGVSIIVAVVHWATIPRGKHKDRPKTTTTLGHTFFQRLTAQRTRAFHSGTGSRNRKEKKKKRKKKKKI